MQAQACGSLFHRAMRCVSAICLRRHCEASCGCRPRPGEWLTQPPRCPPPRSLSLRCLTSQATIIVCHALSLFTSHSYGEYILPGTIPLQTCAQIAAFASEHPLLHDAAPSLLKSLDRAYARNAAGPSTSTTFILHIVSTRSSRRSHSSARAAVRNRR
jgi:hypothetical protein